MSDVYGAGMPDVTQLSSPTGQVGRPEGGAYGEKAAIAEIEKALPPPTTGPEAVQDAPPAAPGSMPIPPPSGDLPRGMFNPAPPSPQPMSAPAPQPLPVGETPNLRARQRIEAWANDPTLHETTRQWARSVLAALGEPQ